ncbi:MAG: archaeosortase/exosortase family protein [Deltaproteobacteria bacterium]|nr:archaeosortase/exosortase family protein [Deltaproteobacteria bacterium]
MNGSSLDAALYDPGVTSPLLGVAVFAALVALRRDRIRAALGGPPLVGLALVASGLGFALFGWSHAIGAPDLVLPGLVLALVGGAAGLGGRALVAAIGFPMLALVCVIRPPEPLLNLLLFPLQQATVALTAGLLSLVGRAHLVAGDLILTNGAAFQVVEGCSGLKTIASLALAAVAYGELVGRRGYEKAVLVALTPALGFLANGLRVLLLVFRKIPAESVEHQVYGVAALLVGVIGLVALEIGLSRTLFRRWPGRVAAESTPVPRAGLGRRVAAWAVGASGVAAFFFLTPADFVRGPRLERPNIEELPLELGGATARGLRIDDDFLGRVRFAHRFYRAYERPGGDRFRVFVGLADDANRDASALSPRTAIPHSGWLALERLEPAPDAPPGSERFRIRYDARQTGDRSLDADDGAEDGSRTRGERTVLVEHIRLGFAPWEIELLRAWLGLDRLDRAPRAPRLVLRVELDAVGDSEAALLRLRQFAQEIVDWYRSAG